MWHDQFPDLLFQFLLQYFPGQPRSNAEMYRAVSALSVQEKRGMFNFISKYLGDVRPVDVKDYYHNTWIKQFSEDIRPYRAEIAELVRTKHVQEGLDIKKTIQAFLDRHPGKDFNHRALQQVFSLLKYRSKAPSSGFSANISDCVNFQLACGTYE
ncbi:Conserved_hypothetical protein [Hexamita inflata]|uniref:Uncharacterized protein n=1 Tax=Hexamita inflata TaxID=28002 RepID=A0AA86R273_9EUKA|nr:Conserved hypothetical protein [Hexamita inflata]